MAETRRTPKYLGTWVEPGPAVCHFCGYTFDSNGARYAVGVDQINRKTRKTRTKLVDVAVCKRRQCRDDLDATGTLLSDLPRTIVRGGITLHWSQALARYVTVPD